MKCSKCGEPTELAYGTFKPTGETVKLDNLVTNVREYKFTCRDCQRSIDNTSREPGSDDEPEQTDW